MQDQKTHPAKPKQDQAPVEPKQLDTNVDDDALDALLDEIDDVLEENAEEFIKGYIQKGGQ